MATAVRFWEYIHRVHCSAGSISEAAPRLGLHRRSLRRMLSKHPGPRARVNGNAHLESPAQRAGVVPTRDRRRRLPLFISDRCRRSSELWTRPVDTVARVGTTETQLASDAPPSAARSSCERRSATSAAFAEGPRCASSRLPQQPRLPRRTEAPSRLLELSLATHERGDVGGGTRRDLLASGAPHQMVLDVRPTRLHRAV